MGHITSCTFFGVRAFRGLLDFVGWGGRRFGLDGKMIMRVDGFLLGLFFGEVGEYRIFLEGLGRCG